MFRNYLKIALRNIRKNKLYSAINIFGLMIGLTACLLIGVYITHELSYDKFNERSSRIVRATMEYSRSGTVTATAMTGTKPGPQFKRLFPAVEEAVRSYMAVRVVKREEKLFEEARFLYADPGFFKIFSFPMLEGNGADALNSPDRVVITEDMARKYFGTGSAINQTLTVGNTDYVVSGVCRNAPKNSQIKFDFVTQFMNLGRNVKDEQWWTANWITYFLLKDQASIPMVQQQIDQYMKTATVRQEAGLEASDYLRYHLEPLTSVHLHSPLAGFEPNGNISYIYMFAIIAILILIIACANYTNLATAQSASRSGEIGMRKVMGAQRKQVFMQFIGESSAITVIAAILALLLSGLLIPYFNSITGKEFTVNDLFQPMPVILLVLFAVFVSLLAGAYPALVLSGTPVMGILRKGFNFTGSNNVLRKSLIVLQFGISVFLIVYTGVIMQQMNFLQHKNLGYDKDHVLILPIDNKMSADYDNLKQALAQVPGVQDITASYETPEFVEWGDGITATDEKGTHEISLNAMPVDLNFTKTMKMQLAAGRDFQLNDFAMMDTANNGKNFKMPYLINESLANKLGWTAESAVGRIINKGDDGPVVGVIKDFNFESLHEPVKPLLLFLSKDLARTFMLRVNDHDMQSMLARLEQVWKQRVAHRPFEYHFLDEDYNKLYIAEQRSSALFGVAAGLAILLGCLGIFGLAAFTTVQRIKEIGIRRVLGADVRSIVMLIARSFLWLVAVAIIVAVPLAWYAGNKWLQDFSYRTQVNSWMIIGTAAAVFLMVLATVSFQAIRAAVMNPVKSLRSE